jgi:hypothetical protein
MIEGYRELSISVPDCPDCLGLRLAVVPTAVPLVDQLEIGCTSCHRLSDIATLAIDMQLSIAQNALQLLEHPGPEGQTAATSSTRLQDVETYRGTVHQVAIFSREAAAKFSEALAVRATTQIFSSPKIRVVAYPPATESPDDFVVELQFKSHGQTDSRKLTRVEVEAVADFVASGSRSKLVLHAGIVVGKLEQRPFPPRASGGQIVLFRKILAAKQPRFNDNRQRSQRKRPGTRRF